jgi:hypothetical protein
MWCVVVGSYPLSSQAPTHVEVELGCDNYSGWWLGGWVAGKEPIIRLTQSNWAVAGTELGKSKFNNILNLLKSHL